MAKMDHLIDFKQVLKFSHCPYCGSDDMYVYTGDHHSYTVCFNCEDELEVYYPRREQHGR